MYDSTASQYYLRARWYSPANGRFNRMDDFSGNNLDPQSLHKYTYVHNNPINGIDPTGQWSYVQVVTVTSIIGGIIGATIGTYVAVKRGYSITEEEFWYWVGGGTLTGVAVGYIAGWALIHYGWITISATGTIAGGNAGNINWLCNNVDKAQHILQNKHSWDSVVNVGSNPASASNALNVYNNSVLPVIQNVVNNPSTQKVVETLNNGVVKHTYTGVYNGLFGPQTIEVRIAVMKTGQQLLDTAMVKQ